MVHWMQQENAVQCLKCRYRLPASFPLCSLCGGDVTAAVQWELPLASQLVQ